ncbi:MAG: carboxypeptidase regulatory-like domain-containing protein, partial [Acidobacteriia bacterium]|nr:carboxypeptidase regulatory-like domain-containing protein [Terriglobia bacterium]
MKTASYRVLLLGAIALCSHSQTITVSQISGIVQDVSGAAIPGAQVTVTNTDTSAARSVLSGADGTYAVTNLAVGPYRLQVTKEGFSTYSQSGIVLQVNTNPEINVVMKVGAVSEQVEIQANAGMVETQNTSVGQVIDQQRVVDLPLNGRNPAQLISLSGAAVVNTAGGIAINLNYPTVAAFSVAGGQGNQTNYFLDGSAHIDPRTNVGLPLPFPDALQEFKVETSTLPANYGG